MSNISIDDALNQASARAATVAPVSSRAMAAAPAGKLSIMQMSAGAASVDKYLKVDEYGLHVGNDKSIFETIRGTIRPKDVRLCKMVRYGNPAKYDRSYNGVTNSSGRPWAEVVAAAQEVDPKCRAEYSAAEIVITLTEPLVLKDKSKIEAGAKIGYTTSITGWGEFFNWFSDLLTSGVDEDSADEIPVVLGYQTQTRNGNTWAVVTYSTPQ